MVQQHVLLAPTGARASQGDTAAVAAAVCLQVPNVTWGDVGGLEDVKQAILDTIELPLKHR
jgi:SpoVK/Ycf46/Vps4 family AAA+-type ATPase